MQKIKDQLSQIAHQLYKPELEPHELYNTCKRYTELLTEVSQFVFESGLEDENIYTDHGKAIGTEWAVRCIQDMQRTKKFCYGIFKAVNHKLALNPGKPVQILYAGTGPFATLVLPLITQFTAEQIQFTLLEINPESKACLETVIKAFEIEAYIKDFELCDALDYTVKDPEMVSIFITETMQSALRHEPQVAITFHLLPQLSEDTILIPEAINLNMLAVNSIKRMEYKTNLDAGDTEYYKDLGLIYSLNRAHVFENSELFKQTQPTAVLPANTIHLPEHVNHNFDKLYITTTIHVYEDQFLNMDESGLTSLIILEPLNQMMQSYSVLKASYVCGDFPALSFKKEQA